MLGFPNEVLFHCNWWGVRFCQTVCCKAPQTMTSLSFCLSGSGKLLNLATWKLIFHYKWMPIACEWIGIFSHFLLCCHADIVGFYMSAIIWRIIELFVVNFFSSLFTYFIYDTHIPLVSSNSQSSQFILYSYLYMFIKSSQRKPANIQ